jgi:hypothetical protein
MSTATIEAAPRPRDVAGLDGARARFPLGTAVTAGREFDLTTPGAGVSFGARLAVSPPAGRTVDLAGVEYCPQRQLATVDGVAFIEAPAPIAYTTTYETVHDHQTMTDRDEDRASR